MTMTQDEGQRFLEPISSVLTGIVLDGIAEYNGEKYNPLVRLIHKARTVSDIYNSHIVHLAQIRLGEALGKQLTVHQKRGRVLFNVGVSVCMSFKKMDRNLRPHNSPTLQAHRFMRQIPLFDNIPTTTNLIIGYRPVDVAQTEFEVWAVCPNGHINSWHHQLFGGQRLDLFTPVEPTAPAPPKLEKPIRLRKPDAASAELEPKNSDANG
ncbi:MAG: hypothetical protein JWO59_685 [Chloroflexi bacterium]|nr:hypothetical protein [Chloroflexota bacterium]